MLSSEDTNVMYMPISIMLTSTLQYTQHQNKNTAIIHTHDHIEYVNADDGTEMFLCILKCCYVVLVFYSFDFQRNKKVLNNICIFGPGACHSFFSLNILHKYLITRFTHAAAEPVQAPPNWPSVSYPCLPPLRAGPDSDHSLSCSAVPYPRWCDRATDCWPAAAATVASVASVSSLTLLTLVPDPAADRQCPESSKRLRDGIQADLRLMCLGIGGRWK